MGDKKYCKTEIERNAEEIVDNVICSAKTLIASDPRGYFFYKKPKEPEIDVTKDTSSLTNNDLNSPISWCLIKNFNKPLVVQQITEYVEKWVLTPNMEYTVQCLNEEPIRVAGKGSYLNILVEFFKTSEECQNPLAHAKVYFRVSVSDRLPKDYPIMVTYNFEGFNTVFYAVGQRALDSMKFQCFYINTILEMKLAFYSEVFECTHPKDCPNCKPSRMECPM